MASYVWLTSSLWQNQRAGNYRRCNWGLNGSKVGSLSALNISLMSCNYWGKFSSFGARSRKKEKECCCCCDRKSLRQKCEPSFSPIKSHLCFWMKANSEFFHVSNFRICFLVSWNFFWFEVLFEIKRRFQITFRIALGRLYCFEKIIRVLFIENGKIYFFFDKMGESFLTHSVLIELVVT